MGSNPLSRDPSDSAHSPRHPGHRRITTSQSRESAREERHRRPDPSSRDPSASLAALDCARDDRFWRQRAKRWLVRIRRTRLVIQDTEGSQRLRAKKSLGKRGTGGPILHRGIPRLRSLRSTALGMTGSGDSAQSALAGSYGGEGGIRSAAIASLRERFASWWRPPAPRWVRIPPGERLWIYKWRRGWDSKCRCASLRETRCLSVTPPAPLWVRIPPGERLWIYKWRRGWDSNPRTACTVNGFRDRPVRPLRHLSA